MIRRVILVILALALLTWFAVQEVQRRWELPLPIPSQGVELTIAAGDSLRAVANRLHSQGLMPHPELLILYGRWSGLDQKIKRGEYLVPPGTTASTLLELLHSGKVVQYQVTLPEGITLAQALSILQQESALESEISDVRDTKVVQLVQPRSNPEGLFFPDSYRYERGDSDWDLLRRAYSAMEQVLASEWPQRMPDLPYETPYEALIMASIIEKETGAPEEREQIAGVFVRRLQQGMRLQTDPTVIYGLGETFDGDLLRSHLRDEQNPYNSYRHHGLPPSPIALPGRASIHAALNPASGDTLYFVATGDGRHVFSATLAEHQRAVRKYQLRRKKNYRSSPEKN